MFTGRDGIIRCKSPKGSTVRALKAPVNRRFLLILGLLPAIQTRNEDSRRLIRTPRL